MPIPAPSVVPSPLPTAYPTSSPSATPSQSPSYVPTALCAPGTQLENHVCVNCIAGRYSNYTNGSMQLTCELCPSSEISEAGVAQW